MYPSKKATKKLSKNSALSINAHMFTPTLSLLQFRPPEKLIDTISTYMKCYHRMTGLK